MQVAELLSGAQNAVYFILALMIIVAVHEFGHYIVGRLCGIHAVTFSLGFGPPLIRRRDRRGTLWQISAIPLGGYVKFLGDGDGASARADDATMAGLSSREKRATLHGAPLWARVLTVAAGPLANVLLTLVLLAGTIAVQGVAVDQPVVGKVNPLPGISAGLQPGDRILEVNGIATPDLKTYFSVLDQLPSQATMPYRVDRAGQTLTVTDAHPLPPLVRDVQPKSAALDAGVKAGDIVTALDGQPIATFDQLPALIAAKAGAPVVVTLWRQGQSFDVTLTPRERDLPDGQGGFTHRWLIGLTGGSLFEPATRHPGLLETARLAAQATWALTTTNVSGIVHILRGTISSCNVSGVIGMAEVVSAAARDGLDAFIQIVAVVSLGIGLMNLLPIPVLDGGHLMFHAWEAIRRRPPSPAAMRLLTSLGLAVLLALMAFAIGNDLTCT